jgi:hypothetical protein
MKNISVFRNHDRGYIFAIPFRSKGRIMIAMKRGTGRGGRR